MPSLCRTKHNRAKPMSESASALFSIADAGEFRFARFYIVCEEVPLGTPESPPIVSGVSDMHPSDCPNVEETRNPMQTFSWKKCSHFFPTNFHLHSIRNPHGVFLIILLIPKRDLCFLHFKVAAPVRGQLLMQGAYRRIQIFNGWQAHICRSFVHCGGK